MRRGSTGLSLVSGLAMLFLYGPILVLVLYSFNAAHLSMAWRGTTLKWYAALWQDEALLAATANSLLIAVISTIGATLLGGLMALGMERMPLRRQQIIEGGLVLPLAVDLVTTVTGRTGGTEVVLTSDNPRSEDPMAILNEMRQGITVADQQRVWVNADRREAIRQAVGMAKPGDVLLLAGKGHETYQEVAGVRHPFDDAAVLKETLELLHK